MAAAAVRRCQLWRCGAMRAKAGARRALTMRDWKKSCPCFDTAQCIWLQQGAVEHPVAHAHGGRGRGLWAALRPEKTKIQGACEDARMMQAVEEYSETSWRCGRGLCLPKRAGLAMHRLLFHYAPFLSQSQFLIFQSLLAAACACPRAAHSSAAQCGCGSDAHGDGTDGAR